MTTPIPPWQAGHTPYVTPDQLSQWGTGVSWNTIPPGPANVSDAQRFAVQAMYCSSATDEVDQILNQPIRATETTEELSGPNFRLTVEWATGNGRFICARWPVTQVLGVQVSPNTSWPRQFTALPAGNFEPEYPVDGLFGAGVPSASGGGQAILFAPGWVGWPGGTGFSWPGGQITGRKQYRVSVNYISGYPHTSLTAAGTQGATTIAVDDCTAWILTGTNGQTIGAGGIIFDAQGGGQEPVQCTAATATTGPGTLTLASGLQYNHAAGRVVSAMPNSVIWATALLTAKIALTRGATATTIQTTGGKQQQTSMHPLEAQARGLLNAFRRTI